MYFKSQKISREAGFTLLEIIVVVAIIGVMVTVLGVSVSRDVDRLARLEAERFHIIVNEVRDEAVLTGESYFLEVDEDGSSYRFESLRAGGGDAELLRRRSLKNGVVLEWEVMELIAQNDEDESRKVPRALISPLGEITPFAARFSGDELAYEVFINEENQLSRRERNSPF